MLKDFLTLPLNQVCLEYKGFPSVLYCAILKLSQSQQCVDKVMELQRYSMYHVVHKNIMQLKMIESCWRTKENVLC